MLGRSSRQRPLWRRLVFLNLAYSSKPLKVIWHYTRMRCVTLCTLLVTLFVLCSIPAFRHALHEASIHISTVSIRNLLQATPGSVLRDGWSAVRPAISLPPSSSIACPSLAANTLRYHRFEPTLAAIQTALASYMSSPRATSPDQVLLARRVAAIIFNASFSRLVVQQQLSQLSPQPPPSLVSGLMAAMDMMMGTGRLLTCAVDETLLEAVSQAYSIPGDPTIRVATVLYNANEVLPNMMYQLLQLSVLLPPGSLFISVYESGSQDKTSMWLHLLQLLLCPLEVPYRIVTAGRLQRARDAETERDVNRIEFLARVRNEALDPLLSGELDPQERAGGSSSSPKARGHVVFINDVFFCTQHLLRLVLLDQDMACGLDLHTEGIFPPKDSRQLWFYDSWVARDILGNMITGSFPHMSDPGSVDRAQQGLPFPVYCCWNGMVALALEPLLRGVRIRASLPGECRASECSLICDDFHRLGFNRVAIDPTVYTTYHMHHAQAVSLKQSSFDPRLEIRQTSWSEVTSAPPLTQRQANTSNVLCCNKAIDSDRIPWKECGPRDVMQVNYTHTFLEGEKRRQQRKQQRH